jgi:hypothetical protein
MLVKYVLMFISLCYVTASQGGTITQSPAQKTQAQAISHAASIIRSFSQNPKNLTTSDIERAFPGEYKIYQCNRDQTFCGRENQNQQQPLRLNSYFVKKDISGASLGGTLSVFVPKSTHCLGKEEFGRIIGKVGERPRAPLPMEQFPNSLHETEYLEYKDINAEYPEVSIGAFVEDDCVVHITLDALLNN